MGLKCMGPVICRFFSVVSTTVLHDPRLVAFLDMELQIQRASYKLKVIWEFSTPWRIGVPNPSVVQGSLVYPSKLLGSKTLVSFLTPFFHILHPVCQEILCCTNIIILCVCCIKS